MSQWTADELNQKTRPTGSFTETAAFLNDDDTGSYRLTFVVDRVPI